MGSISTQDEFLTASDKWICDNYALDIRYIAKPTDGSAQIICASISISPVKAVIDNSCSVATKGLVAGQVQIYPAGREELRRVLKDAIRGRIILSSLTLEMQADSSLDYYSQSTHQNSWFSDLNLQIDCNSNIGSLFSFSGEVDNDLRLSDPPFDGVNDLAVWLGFDRFMNDQLATIVIRISPPVALVYDNCRLQNDCLTLSIEAHGELDLSRVSLAVRGVPGEGVASRVQAANLIEWGEPVDGLRHGVAHINIKNCDSAFAMLMMGSSTVRRQWFLDAAKARNNRYMAIKNFDIDLRQIRKALLDSGDFEKGVAALLFLLGFSPVLQLETDSPDLIVTTPAGQTLIVECTTRIADFSEKLGKLVDRRGSLSKSLSDAGHPSDIIPVLICRSSKDQIAVKDDELKKYKVILLTKEDVEFYFNGVRNPNDADKIVDALKGKVFNEASSM